MPGTTKRPLTAVIVIAVPVDFSAGSRPAGKRELNNKSTIHADCGTGVIRGKVKSGKEAGQWFLPVNRLA